MSRSSSWGFPRWGGYNPTDRDTVSVQMCEWRGCTEKGDCPAPKFRDSDERWWFCQEHASLYNRNWDYFRGLSKEEAERLERQEELRSNGYADAGTFRDARTGNTKEERERNAALEVLELDGTATQPEIKQAYRQKAKEYHPDANPGDEDAAENFKSVLAAYEILKQR